MTMKPQMSILMFMMAAKLMAVPFQDMTFNQEVNVDALATSSSSLS